MRSIAVWICSLCLPALGLAGQFAAGRYTVILMPGHRYSTLAVQEMGREAAVILKRSGIDVQLHIGYTREVFEGSLVVVNLRGNCDMEEDSPAAQGGPLGWTHSANGALLPFAELACEPIRAAVQSAPAGLGASRGNAMLGRAMGRVLAHELYHIAGETLEHGRDGVAQPSLTAQELTSSQLQLDREDVATIQHRLPGSR